MSTSTPEPEVSEEELRDYEELRSLFSPTVGVQLLDEFAKWLFALAGTTGAIGAGFGVSGANNLSHSGHRWFAWAVASVACSLALAAISRLPLPMKVIRYSPRSMTRAIRRLFVIRFCLLAVAAVAFAGGLVLAGIAQVV
jgi:hypothetical protein